MDCIENYPCFAQTYGTRGTGYGSKSNLWTRVSPGLTPQDVIERGRSFDHRGPEFRAQGIGEILIVLPLTARSLQSSPPPKKRLFGNNNPAPPKVVVRPAMIDHERAFAVIYHTLTAARCADAFGKTHVDTLNRPGLSVFAGSVLPHNRAIELFEELESKPAQIRDYGRLILDGILGISDDTRLLNPYPQYERWPGMGITKGAVVDATELPAIVREYTVAE